MSLISRFGSYVALITLCLSPLSGTSAASGSGPKAPAALSLDWTRKMREMEKVLQDLLLDVSSDERFNSPQNADRIRDNAKSLARLAHDLKSGKVSAPDSDPSLKIITELFDEEASHAQKMLATGHRGYARGVLRAMPGYCIACHTRNASGPRFSGTSEPPGFAALSWLEKGNYLAATRRFDQALEGYEGGISNREIVSKQVFDWEKGVRLALAISVRVKKDPARASKIVEQVLAAPNAPFFLKEQAAKWKESLALWKAEPKREATTEEGLFAEATRLIAEAKLIQKYPADRSADVVYLRASAVVHDLLSMGPIGKRMAEALYLAGICYDALQGLNFWDLHEFYYLACIRQSPHSEISRECFKRYQESVFSGYTGSGGTDLPLEIEARLQQFDEMSKPIRPPSQK